MPIICAGVASMDITPPIGVDLAGGAFGESAGVLHPLTAQALFLTDGFTGALLITADVVGFDTPYAEAIRATAARRCGVPVQNIMLAATHTHNGPATATYRNWGRPDDAYRRKLQGQLVELAARAAASPQPAEIGAGYAVCEGLSVNRVVEGGPVDEQVGVVRIDGADGRPLAALVNYACHPATLHDFHALMTPDFPHLVRAEIRQAMGEDVEVLYLTGACGDLNPAGFVFGDTERAPANCRRTGQELAASALYALARARGEQTGQLACASAECALPLAPLPPERRLLEMIAQYADLLTQIPEPGPRNWEYCEVKTRLEWAREALAFLQSGQPQPAERPVPLQALRLGPAAILGIPGELFSAFGREIKAASPCPTTLISTQTSGSEGYFPDQHAFTVKHYEAVLCPMYCNLFCYQPHVGEVVARAGAELLGQLVR
ncbi:MAG: hypothetical protein ACYDCO_02720 [Armatimonadota bacterium]